MTAEPEYRYVTFLVPITDATDDPENWREQVGNGTADIVRDEIAEPF